jgi:hypothetical protein
MKILIAVAVIATMVVAGAPVQALQKDVSASIEAQAWRDAAAAIPLGSRVKVQLLRGRRFNGTLIGADNNGVLVKKNTRMSEPAIAIRFDELARLERVEGGNGMGVGKAIGIGLATGVGAILTLFAVLVTIGD